MKAKKALMAAAMVVAVCSIGATPPKATEEKCLQCGVTNAQITTYLETCSHHHSVTSVSDIPGTCNSLAGIENCGTATVYVNNGIIIGHTDDNGICGN